MRGCEQRKKAACLMDNLVIRYKDGIPVVECRGFGMRIGEPSWSFKCPWCSKVHTHGAGAGHRQSHCNHETPKKRGYYLEALDASAIKAEKMAQEMEAGRKNGKASS